MDAGGSLEVSPVRSGYPLSAAILLLLLLALLTGFRPLYLLLYLTAGLAVLGYAWAWLMTRGLHVAIQALATHPEVGKPISFRATVQETTGFPRAGLRARIVLDFADTAEEPIALAPHGQLDWVGSAVCERRGVHRVGSVRIVGQDPFGLVRVGREIGETREIIVYPATVPLVSASPRGNTGLEGGSYGAGGAGPRHVHTTPATVREYQPGDRISSIHWPSTARMGVLMAKQFQRVEAAEVWLLLDFQEDTQAGTGVLTTEEYAVTIAASLARHFITWGQSVGLAYQGSEWCSMSPRRGPEQLDGMLRVLAVTSARGKLPMAAVVSRHASRFSPGSLVVTVQPTSSPSVRAALESLRRSGVTVMAVLLDADSFDARSRREAATSAATRPAPDGVDPAIGWSRLVRQGDDLSDQLGGLLGSLTV